MSRWDTILELRRRRPRSRLVRGSLALAIGLVLAAWLTEGFDFGELLRAERREAAGHFVRVELVPFELRDRAFGLGELWSWMGERMRDRGAEAALNTLALATMSIVLATVLGGLLAPFAARNIARAEPFAAMDHQREGRAERRRWIALRAAVRSFFGLARAVPEFFWAFLLVGILGPTAWPAILALALHNTGSLGRLGADTLENVEAAAPRALRDLGAGRPQIVLFAALPLGFNRLLSYFFYRFETGVREASVLGMLGISTLGYWIDEARARHFYDQMVFLVLLAVGLVLAADLASVAVRAGIGRSQR